MKKQKIIIIGGNAAGAGAAGKAARVNKDTEIFVFEKGPYISYANCGLPYYLGGLVRSRNALIIRKPEDLIRKYGMSVFVNREVVSINRHAKTVTVKNLEDNSLWEETYDTLILATGAHSFIPPIPGIDARNVFSLRTVPDADAIKDYIDAHNPQRVVILGGGYIGVETADALHRCGITVDLVEMMPGILPLLDLEVSALVRKKMEETGIGVHTGEKVERIETDPHHKASAVITDSGRRLETDFIIASLGIRPDLTLAEKSGLEIGRFGVVTDEYMKTSDRNIYAAGDIVQVKDLVTGKPTWSPLAVEAGFQGRIAGANAAGAKERYRGALRTSIVQFGSFAAGKTGLTENDAKREDIDCFHVSITASSHAGYYPGAKPLTLKGVFKKPGGKLLGIQAAGELGVDKKIDVAAALLTAGMSAKDLEYLEHAYAPQFSSGIDPFNILGSLAVTKLEE